jgi:hypothetical protein
MPLPVAAVGTGLASAGAMSAFKTLAKYGFFVGLPALGIASSLRGSSQNSTLTNLQRAQHARQFGAAESAQDISLSEQETFAALNRAEATFNSNEGLEQAVIGLGSAEPLIRAQELVRGREQRLRGIAQVPPPGKDELLAALMSTVRGSQ